jgi:hypothetical protein
MTHMDDGFVHGHLYARKAVSVKCRGAKMGLMRKMSGLARLLLFGLMAAVSKPASAVEAERPGQESSLTRAVFAEGRLWVLSEAGVVSSVMEGRDTRDVAPLPDKALDLCVRGGHPMVITGAEGRGSVWAQPGSVWALHQFGEGVWSAAATIATEGDGLLALDCTANRVTLLTTRRLIDLDGNRQSAVTLSGKLGGGLIGATYGTPDQFFVGFNAGEWGGGLRRIDRRSGGITEVERNATGDLCGGPLNASCDPVNGMVADPWKSDCVLVAVGLVHMMPNGRVVEVCGDQVQELYSKPNRSPGGAFDPFGTVAFFGLARDGDTVQAAGTDGIYRIGPEGAAEIVPMPRFKDIAGVHVSFELPQIVLVLTTVNQHHSVSGAVPLLVPR